MKKIVLDCTEGIEAEITGFFLNAWNKLQDPNAFEEWLDTHFDKAFRNSTRVRNRKENYAEMIVTNEFGVKIQIEGNGLIGIVASWNVIMEDDDEPVINPYIYLQVWYKYELSLHTTNGLLNKLLIQLKTEEP